MLRRSAHGIVPMESCISFWRRRPGSSRTREWEAWVWEPPRYWLQRLAQQHFAASGKPGRGAASILDGCSGSHSSILLLEVSGVWGRRLVVHLAAAPCMSLLACMKMQGSWGYDRLGRCLESRVVDCFVPACSSLFAKRAEPSRH